MKDKDIDFLKTLIIKLDISIEAEHNNVSAEGLMLIFDFSEKNRKESITKALDILNKTQNKWKKLKEWLKNQITDLRHIEIKTETQSLRVNDAVNCFRQVLGQMQELEGEDEI